jgi:hypothetical protein
MPRKTFTAGTLATASDINTFLMNQSVMTFTNATARDTAIPAPTEGMVTYQTQADHLTIYDGTVWRPFDIQWATYTPTFANFTLGNGTVTAKYVQQARMVTVSIQVTLGSTSVVSATGGIQFSLPIAQASTARFHGVARCVIGSTFLGTLIASGSNAIVYVNNVSATYETVTLTTNAIPGTWTNGSSFIAQATYEV